MGNLLSLAIFLNNLRKKYARMNLSWTSFKFVVVSGINLKLMMILLP